jgi:hypothetical protein
VLVGKGPRGIVFGHGPTGPGHVFLGVNQDGIIRFLDPQIGAEASFDGFDAFKYLVIPPVSGPRPLIVTRP